MDATFQSQTFFLVPSLAPVRTAFNMNVRQQQELLFLEWIITLSVTRCVTLDVKPALLKCTDKVHIPFLLASLASHN